MNTFVRDLIVQMPNHRLTALAKWFALNAQTPQTALSARDDLIKEMLLNGEDPKCLQPVCIAWETACSPQKPVDPTPEPVPGPKPAPQPKPPVPPPPPSPPPPPAPGPEPAVCPVPGTVAKTLSYGDKADLIRIAAASTARPSEDDRIASWLGITSMEHEAGAPLLVVSHPDLACSVTPLSFEKGDSTVFANLKKEPDTINALLALGYLVGQAEDPTWANAMYQGEGSLSGGTAMAHRAFVDILRGRYVAALGFFSIGATNRYLRYTPLYAKKFAPDSDINTLAQRGRPITWEDLRSQYFGKDELLSFAIDGIRDLPPAPHFADDEGMIQWLKTQTGSVEAATDYYYGTGNWETRAGVKQFAAQHRSKL